MKLKEKINEIHANLYLYFIIILLSLMLLIGFTIAISLKMILVQTLTQDQFIRILIEGISTLIALLLILVTITEGRRARAEIYKQRQIEQIRRQLEFYSLFKSKMEILYIEEKDTNIKVIEFEQFLNIQNIASKYMQWASIELQNHLTSYFAFYFNKNSSLMPEKIELMDLIARTVDDDYKDLIKNYNKLLTLK